MTAEVGIVDLGDAQQTECLQQKPGTRIAQDWSERTQGSRYEHRSKIAAVARIQKASEGAGSLVGV